MDQEEAAKLVKTWIEEDSIGEIGLMKTSDQIDKLVEGFALARKAFKPVVKNRQNPHFRNRYADLASILDATVDALSDNGLVVVQSPAVKEGRVTVISRLLHKSGQWLETELSLKPSGDTPQTVGSAITYGRRYSAAAILCISEDEDDDGEASEGRAPPQVAKVNRAPKALTTVISNGAIPPAVYDKTNKNFQLKLGAYLGEKNKSSVLDAVADRLHGREFKREVIDKVLADLATAGD